LLDIKDDYKDLDVEQKKLDIKQAKGKDADKIAHGQAKIDEAHKKLELKEAKINTNKKKLLIKN